MHQNIVVSSFSSTGVEEGCYLYHWQLGEIFCISYAPAIFTSFCVAIQHDFHLLREEGD